MTDRVLEALASAGIADVRREVPTSQLTTLCVGGSARWLVTAETDGDLTAVGRVSEAHDVPWCVVGRGSNLLVSDDGFPGVMVVLGRGYRSVAIDGTTVVAGAAVAMPSLAARVADAGLEGFAWACAVPGTLGGAVRMNAGAHGGEMSERLVEVDMVRLRSGARETWPATTLGLGYRSSGLPGDGVVVSATLDLVASRPEVVHREVAEVRAWRRRNQPLSEPNCGSVFTNPPGHSAGALIDEAGAKGMSVGGAKVSEMHANFVVTRPGATAGDVLELVERVRALVLERTGIELVAEVRVVGSGAQWTGRDATSSAHPDTV